MTKKNKDIQKYSLTGCCATFVEFTVDKDNRVHNIKFDSGCIGNLQAVAVLAEGRSVPQLIKMLRGIKCRSTGSCPDSFAKALQDYQEKQHGQN